MKLITVRPKFDFRIGDFYSGSTQKQSCKEEEASSSRVRERLPINNPFTLSEALEERPSKKQRKENPAKYFQMVFTVRLFYTSTCTCFGFYQFTTKKYSYWAQSLFKQK